MVVVVVVEQRSSWRKWNGPTPGAVLDGGAGATTSITGTPTARAGGGGGGPGGSKSQESWWSWRNRWWWSRIN